MEYRYITADHIRPRILARPKTKRGKARWHAAIRCEPCAERYAAHRAAVIAEAEKIMQWTAAERYAWVQEHPPIEFVYGCDAEGCWKGLILVPRGYVPKMNEITDEDRDHTIAVAMAQPRTYNAGDAQKKHDRLGLHDEAQGLRAPKY